MIAPVVGFDLDMTLVDTRPGIAATYRELTARTGVYVDVAAVVSRLGPPLADEMANWFPPEQVAQAVALYRELYPAYAIESGSLLPGADEAVAAVHRHGGQVVVVTSKLGRLARAHLDHVRLTVDTLAGDRFGDGKAAAIIEHGVRIYVGDHVADVRAARAAGVTAVGVATGPYEESALATAGADTVLPDLRDFPQWLVGELRSAPIAEDVPTGSG